jgi:hypothetical protein
MVVPDTYPAEDFAANARVELELRSRLKALGDKMKSAEASTAVRPTAAELEQLFSEGAPSLKSITENAFRDSLSSAFRTFATAAGNSWTPVDPPPTQGGVYGGFIFSAEGTDLRQVTEKGLFGAAHFREAARLMNSDASPAAVDRMLALFGAHPSFPMDPKAATNPDVHSASYATRRTNKNAATPGLYLQMKTAFLEARTAAAAGEVCNDARVAALATIRSNWERALVGTTVFYLNDSLAKLRKPTPTEAERASALHGYGEAIGFLRGLRAVPSDARKLSTAKLDEILATLKAPVGGPAKSYLFLTNSALEVDHFSDAIDAIQAAFAFTPEEVANFKLNF